MRYYIYLDKLFLRNIFSCLDSFDFNIEVVEYSVRKSNTLNKQLGLSPHVEDFCESEKESLKSIKDNHKKYKNANMSKKSLRSDVNVGSSSTIETQRRYINIEDISEMKNDHFYHDMIERLKFKNEKEDKDNRKRSKTSRIIEDEGLVKTYEDSRFKANNTNTDFFLLNNRYIWYDKSLIKCDINLLAQMKCEVKVIGYNMNDSSNYNSNNSNNSGNCVTKAIGIYIE